MQSGASSSRRSSRPIALIADQALHAALADLSQTSYFLVEKGLPDFPPRFLATCHVQLDLRMDQKHNELTGHRAGGSYSGAQLMHTTKAACTLPEELADLLARILKDATARDGATVYVIGGHRASNEDPALKPLLSNGYT